jgi:hypothetical protein
MKHHWKEFGVSEDLQEGERKILVEGSHGGCTSTCEGVHEFPTEQVRAYTSYRTTSSIVDSRVEVG